MRQRSGWLVNVIGSMALPQANARDIPSSYLRRHGWQSFGRDDSTLYRRTARHVGAQGHKYKLYPTRKQTQALESQLGEACTLYNAALQERRDAYRKARTSLNYYDQAHQLKAIRADGTWVWRISRPARMC